MIDKQYLFANYKHNSPHILFKVQLSSPVNSIKDMQSKFGNVGVPSSGYIESRRYCRGPR